MLKRAVIFLMVLVVVGLMSNGASGQRDGGGGRGASQLAAKKKKPNPKGQFLANLPPGPPTSSGNYETELSKFKDPAKSLVAGKPNGTKFEKFYRSLLKKNSKSVAMKQPSHWEAAKTIKEDAANGPEDLQKQKNYVLFIVYASSAYRGPEGTASLKGLYTELVNMEFEMDAPSYSYPGGRESEMAEFENAEKSVRSTPAGTSWLKPYSGFAVSSADAVARELPSHEEASKRVLDFLKVRPNEIREHKKYIRYVKAVSEEKRPAEATAALRKLYNSILDIEFDPVQEVTPALPFDGDERLTIFRNVVYGKEEPSLQTLDAYIVKSDKPTPVMVEIHGGGWRRGKKNSFGSYGGDLIGKLFDAGISVVSIDYRLTPEYQVPAMMHDAARAIQLVRSKAKEWNIDSAHVGAMGGSAGAHMSAWIAFHDDMADPDSDDPIARQSTRLSCIIDQSGPMDLTKANPLELSKALGRGEDFSKAFTQAFGCTLEEYMGPDIQKRAREASPIFCVTKDDPPAMIVHQSTPKLAGDDHGPIPETINDPHSAWFGIMLYEEMKEKGIDAVKYIGPHVGKDKEKDALAKVKFLTKHLRAE
ncbi:alpha/beta hydrolase fold domain-containing protein [Candidatus Hydrogenedentota bacterium]